MPLSSKRPDTLVSNAFLLELLSVRVGGSVADKDSYLGLGSREHLVRRNFPEII